MITLASLIGAVVVGLVLGLNKDNDNNSPGEMSRSESIELAILSEFGRDLPLHEPDNVFSQSYEWMASNDTYVTHELRTPEERARFRQRYAICVFAFSTRWNKWLRSEAPFGETDECTWDGFLCNSKGGLSAIQLGMFQSGTAFDLLIAGRFVLTFYCRNHGKAV
jgi:hypothetical protein